MSARRRLPNRRASLSTDLVLGGWPPVIATVSLDATGRVAELFLRTRRPDSDADRLLEDAAVLASLALQHGARAGDLAPSVARRSGVAQSPLGMALDFAAAIDAEGGTQ